MILVIVLGSIIFVGWAILLIATIRDLIRGRKKKN